MNIKQWFQAPSSTLSDVGSYNPPGITPGLMGGDCEAPIPPPQTLYDLAQFRTPYAAVWNRPANVLQG